MSLATFIEHGLEVFDYPDLEIRRVKSDLDEIRQTWQTKSESSYAIGGAFPGRSGFVITDIATTIEVPGSCYVHKLSGKGSASGQTDKTTQSPVVTRHMEGYDQASRVTLSTRPQTYDLGQALPGYPNMFCTEVEKEPHDQSPGWFWVSQSYIGIAGTKSIKRTYTVDENTVSIENGNINITGWGVPVFGKVEMSWPNIVVEDTSIVSLSASALNQRTAKVPGTVVPPNPPSVFSVNLTGELQAHAPNGWTYTFSWSPIPTKTVGILVERYKFVHALTP